MDVSIAEAKNRLTELRVRLGGMKDRIQLLPGWDAPVDLDRFLKGDM